MKRFVLGVLSIAVLSLVPAVAPAGQLGTTEANWGSCSFNGLRTLDLRLQGPLYVGGQKFVGSVVADRISMVGCSDVMQPFTMHSRPLLEPTGRLTASCTGTFHFKQPPLAASTAHIDCQAKLVTSSRTSYAPMSISMQYRRNPFYIDQCDLVPCEDPPSRNYGLIGTYFRQ